MLEIINAEYLHDWIIRVEFNNMETHEIDFANKLATDSRSVFKPLKDTKIFADFKVDYTLTWLYGKIDMAPEYIYFLAHKNDHQYSELFKQWGYVA